jgi:hypothetical protein
MAGADGDRQCLGTSRIRHGIPQLDGWKRLEAPFRLADMNRVPQPLRESSLEILAMEPPGRRDNRKSKEQSNPE